MTTMKRPILIDTDPGIDDVVAISAALFAETLDVRLITTVAGNVSVEHTTRNALDLVHNLGKNVPVAKGASGPLVGEPPATEPVHGETGIGDYRFPQKADGSALKHEHAILAMREEIMISEEPVTLVAIGPLTNIALLLKVFPEVKTNIREMVLMGGAAAGGNVTPVAEFNIYADPHAARVVYTSGIPIVMCGLDVTEATSVTWNDILAVKNTGNTGEMVHAMMQHYLRTYREEAITIHDLCTIVYLTHTDLFQTSQADIRVVTEGEAAGCTVTYFHDRGDVAVGMKADNDAFREAFVSTFQEMDKQLTRGSDE